MRVPHQDVGVTAIVRAAYATDYVTLRRDLVDFATCGASAVAANTVWPQRILA